MFDFPRSGTKSHAIIERVYPAFFAPSAMRYLTRHRLWMMSNGKSSGLPKFLLRTPITALSPNFLSKGKPILDCPTGFYQWSNKLIASLPGLSGDLPTAVTPPTQRNV
jgi:hypothetical protein